MAHGVKIEPSSISPVLTAVRNGQIDGSGNTQLLQTIHYKDDVDTWTTDIDAIDGSELVQMRYTFLSNIATGLNAELSAVGIAYSQ